MSTSSSVIAFRQSFQPEWFLNIFHISTPKEIPSVSTDEKLYVTQSLALRFLFLMLQCDCVFQKEFCGKDGMKFLQNVLPHHADVADILPLLGMFFRIPLQLLPLPHELYDEQSSGNDYNSNLNLNLNNNGSAHNDGNNEKIISKNKNKNEKELKSEFITSKIIQKIPDFGPRSLEILLNFKNCSGPDLSENGLKEFSLPLFVILMECLTCSCVGNKFDNNYCYENGSDDVDSSNNQSYNRDYYNDNDRNENKNDNKNEQHTQSQNTLSSIILSTLSTAFKNLISFRLFLMDKGSLQVLMNSILHFSDTNSTNNSVRTQNVSENKKINSRDRKSVV